MDKNVSISLINTTVSASLKSLMITSFAVPLPIIKPIIAINNKIDKNFRTASLASDLISARHDNRISEKHFLLADKFTKKGFQCTPRQIITLLNHYGHTCSYKSYMKMKTLRQQATSELGDELIEEIEKIIHNNNNNKSSESAIDLIQF